MLFPCVPARCSAADSSDHTTPQGPNPTARSRSRTNHRFPPPNRRPPRLHRRSCFPPPPATGRIPRGAGGEGAAMAASDVPMSPGLEQVDGKIRDIFRALQNGFQKIDEIKDCNRQSKQLEELTGKMRECKRLIKEFDRVLKDEEKRNTSEVNKQLNDKKQFMIKELNYYVTLRKTYQSSLGNKRIELFDADHQPA